MPRNKSPSRRGFLRGVSIAAGTLALGGCDALSQSPWFRNVLFSAERLTRGTQRLALGSNDLAPEYTEADLSPKFRANGSTAPDDPTYVAMSANGFSDWKLKVDGLVEQPAEYSLTELRAMPSR